MNNITDILVKAKALIDTPEKWIKGSNAEDGNGVVVSLEDKRAVCFCTVGAVLRVSEDIGVECAALDLLYSFVKGEYDDIPEWNDTYNRTHAEVMAVFDKAIEISKEMK